MGMPQGKLVSSPSSNIPIGFILFLGFLWDSYRKRGGSVKTSWYRRLMVWSWGLWNKVGGAGHVWWHGRGTGVLIMHAGFMFCGFKYCPHCIWHGSRARCGRHVGGCIGHCGCHLCNNMGSEDGGVGLGTGASVGGVLWWLWGLVSIDLHWGIIGLDAHLHQHVLGLVVSYAVCLYFPIFQ